MLILADLGHDPKRWPSEAATAADQSDDRGALLACGGCDSGRPIGGLGGRSPPRKGSLVSPTGGSEGSPEKPSWVGSAPQTPPLVGRCRGLRRPGGSHGHRFGQPLSWSPKASVWGHVQDQPRSACLVRMIWVKDQHSQHLPWTLSSWKQGGGAPLPPFV